MPLKTKIETEGIEMKNNKRSLAARFTELAGIFAGLTVAGIIVSIPFVTLAVATTH